MTRKIVAVNGTIGSGKDAFSKTFIDNGFTKMSFAHTLKDAVSVIFGWDRTMLEGTTAESRKLREEPDSFWCKKLGRNDVSPRWVLQNFGTDTVRKHFHDNIWVFSLEKAMQNIEGDIIITDCRFPNELEMLRENNAVIIEVQRIIPHWYNVAARYNNDFIDMLPVELEDIHKSEWAWIGLNDPHYVVQNNSTLHDLALQAQDIIKLIK